MNSEKTIVSRGLSAVLALLIFAGPGCFVTDMLQIPPLGSITGEEVRERVRSLVQVNFFLGVYSYCSQFDPIDVCLDESLSPAITGGIVASLLVSSRIEGLEDDKYYTVDSVSDCLRAVALSSNLLAFTILDGEKNCTTIGCAPASGSKVSSAGLTVGLIGAELCELKETGNVFSAGQYNLSLPLPEPLD